MATPTEQAQNFSERVLVAMRRRKPRMTITALAKKIGRDRATVSLAINHGSFPKVQAEIAAKLGLQP